MDCIQLNLNKNFNLFCKYALCRWKLVLLEARGQFHKDFDSGSDQIKFHNLIYLLHKTV